MRRFFLGAAVLAALSTSAHAEWFVEPTKTGCYMAQHRGDGMFGFVLLRDGSILMGILDQKIDPRGTYVLRVRIGAGDERQYIGAPSGTVVFVHDMPREDVSDMIQGPSVNVAGFGSWLMDGAVQAFKDMVLCVAKSG